MKPPHRHRPRPRHPAAWSPLRRLGLAGLLVAVVGCSSPLAGTWQGTVDLGPVDAWPLRVAVAQDGKTARVHVAEKGRPFHDFQACSLSLTARALELVYDAGRPNCDAQGADPSDRRTLRGTVGEGVVFGDVLRGGVRVGFFRAFLDLVPLADEATDTAP